MSIQSEYLTLSKYPHTSNKLSFIDFNQTKKRNAIIPYLFKTLPLPPVKIHPINTPMSAPSRSYLHEYTRVLSLAHVSHTSPLRFRAYGRPTNTRCPLRIHAVVLRTAGADWLVWKCARSKRTGVRARVRVYAEEQRGLARSWNGATYQNDYLSLPFTLIDKSCYVNECSSGRGGHGGGDGSICSRAT